MKTQNLYLYLFILKGNYSVNSEFSDTSWTASASHFDKFIVLLWGSHVRLLAKSADFGCILIRSTLVKLLQGAVIQVTIFG